MTNTTEIPNSGDSFNFDSNVEGNGFSTNLAQNAVT